jgi:hypothetical protein
MDVMLMARMTLAAVFGFSLIVCGPQVPLAQGAAPPPAVAQSASPDIPDTLGAPGAGRAAMSACRADMAAFCNGLGRGGGRKFACLKENQAKLSAPCQAAIQTVVDQRGQMGGGRGHGHGKGGKAMAACRADIASVCAGVPKGKGGVGMCLRENAAKLSQPCQSMLSERKALRKAVQHACKGDKAVLCGSVEKGKAMQQCLREKQAQASPGCQQALLGLTR